MLVLSICKFCCFEPNGGPDEVLVTVLKLYLGDEDVMNFVSL